MIFNDLFTYLKNYGVSFDTLRNNINGNILGLRFCFLTFFRTLQYD